MDHPDRRLFFFGGGIIHPILRGSTQVYDPLSSLPTWTAGSTRVLLLLSAGHVSATAEKRIQRLKVPRFPYQARKNLDTTPFIHLVPCTFNSLQLP